MEFQTATIKNIVRMTPNTNHFLLQTDSTLDYKPGQHVVIKADIDGEEVMHPYTMTNLPGTDKICLAIKEYDEGTLSVYMNERSKGDTVRVSEPKGNLHIRDYDNDVVFISTGTGATPMIAMLREYVRKGTGNAYYMHGEKDPDHAFFKQILDHVEAENDKVKTLYSYSDSDEGRHGHIQNHLNSFLSDYDKDFYVCGVPEMVVETKQKLKKEASTVYSEGWEENV